LQQSVEHRRRHRRLRRLRGGNALNGGALQRYFARDPESWAARLYLGYERMSIG
jgi:hypothetical protein